MLSLGDFIEFFPGRAHNARSLKWSTVRDDFVSSFHTLLIFRNAQNTRRARLDTIEMTHNLRYCGAAAASEGKNPLLRSHL